MRETAYRCTNCLDHTETRTYDVSHLSVTCPNCEEFARFVHEGVLDLYEQLEEAPPDDLDWDRLDDREKFMIAEGVVRQGRSIDDYEIDDFDD